MGNKASNKKQSGKTFTHATSVSVASIQSQSNTGTSRRRGESTSADDQTDAEIGGDIKYDLDALEEDIEHNGITGEYISPQIAEIVAAFWREHIMKMSKTDQLEVACAIGFSVIAQNKEIKEIYFNSCRDVKLQDLSMKLFDLFGWIICKMDKHDIDLYSAIISYKDRCKEQNLQIKFNHFQVILNELNETLIYYFKEEYYSMIQQCMSQSFMLFANLMIDDDHTMDTMTPENEENIFESLELCLKSENGQRSLYQYLNDIYCNELVVFLEMYFKLKNEQNEEQKLEISKSIIKSCIDIKNDSQTIIIEISDHCKKEILCNMDQTDKINILFDSCYKEIYQLILRRHWSSFKQRMD